MTSTLRRQDAQRRAIWTLSMATVLGGLGIGAAFSAGSLLIVEVSGRTELSGFASTMVAVGAALAGIPLARFASKSGRRVALATGNAVAALGALIIIWSSIEMMTWLLILGFGVLGVASAVQLQARFAAADLALPERRARDLSLVVWSITVGAVIGPNLIGPGEVLGETLGIPGLSGVFAFTVLAQALSAALVLVRLRPDPLLEARRRDAHALAVAEATPRTEGRGGPGGVEAPVFRATRSSQFTAIALIALAHAVMVGIMAMTPVHLVHHGGTVMLVGVTISLHVAGMYALSPVAGYLTARWGAVPVIAGGFILLALSALGTAFGGASVAVIQTALILLGLGWCAVTVAGAVLLTNVTPLSDRPSRQGQSDALMNAAGAAFGAASGSLFAFGGFQLLSLVSGLLIIAGMILALRLGRGLTH